MNDLKYNDLNNICNITCDWMSTIPSILSYENDIPKDIKLKHEEFTVKNDMKTLKNRTCRGYINEMDSEIAHSLDILQGYFKLILDNKHVNCDELGINTEQLNKLCKLINEHVNSYKRLNGEKLQEYRSNIKNNY